MELVYEEEVEEEKEEEKTSDAFLTPKDLASQFLKRVRKDKDVALGISGYEGDGKSVLACWIVIEVLRQLGKTEEEIKERFNDYMIYSPNKKEMFEKITRPEKYTPINSDEATKALYKLNWASSSQKFLNTLFQLCRKENKINILCIPRFTDLNEYFRNHRVRFWLHILETGTAVLMDKDWSPFSKDPWHLDENKKTIDLGRKRGRIEEVDLNYKLNLMKRVRGFVTALKWEDLPADYKKIYRAGKNKYGYEDMEVMDEEMGGGGRIATQLKETRLKMMQKLLDEGKTRKEIGEFLGISKATMSAYMKEINSSDLGSDGNTT